MVQVKVIAGESMGKQAVIDTKIPIIYLHFTIQPGGKIIQHVPKTTMLLHMWQREPVYLEKNKKL